ncbi:MAG: hypothetical protein M0036_04950 [Desulfobacteraceae bacterium]|nr:hypothetical protein [Desulfobacteraceae bacterium]
MRTQLKVMAPEGRICPMEGGKRIGIIGDRTPVGVPDTAYYRRLLAEGSLIRPAKTKPLDDPDMASRKRKE